MPRPIDKERAPRQVTARQKQISVSGEAKRISASSSRGCSAGKRHSTCQRMRQHDRSRQGGKVGEYRTFSSGKNLKKQAHDTAATLPHIGAKRRRDDTPVPAGIGRQIGKERARLLHHLKFERPAANGLPDVVRADQHHRPRLTRGRTLDANQAGPGDGTMRINALQRLGDPVCLSHDRLQGAWPQATAAQALPARPVPDSQPHPQLSERATAPSAR